MGCHIVLNYKDKAFRKEFRKIGLIDVYFDNGRCIFRPCIVVECVETKGFLVGGEILDAALAQLKPYARIVACGAISTYK